MMPSTPDQRHLMPISEGRVHRLEPIKELLRIKTRGEIEVMTRLHPEWSVVSPALRWRPRRRQHLRPGSIPGEVTRRRKHQGQGWRKQHQHLHRKLQRHGEVMTVRAMKKARRLRKSDTIVQTGVRDAVSGTVYLP